MTSFSLNLFSNQIQSSHVFLIIQFPESSNLKQSYPIADETRDFPCIPVLPENFQSEPPVFSSALIQEKTSKEFRRKRPSELKGRVNYRARVYNFRHKRQYKIKAFQSSLSHLLCNGSSPNGRNKT